MVKPENWGNQVKVPRELGHGLDPSGELPSPLFLNRRVGDSAGMAVQEVRVQNPVLLWPELALASAMDF